MKSTHGKLHNPSNIQVALVLFLFSVILTAAANWGCIWTYHEYRGGNIATQSGTCVRLDQSRTDESYGRMGFRTTYVLLLEDGTKLGMYSELAEEQFSALRIEDLDFLKNQEFTFTYIPRRIFTDGSYTVLSISNDSESILAECDVLSYYYDRLQTSLIWSCVVDGIALLFILVPPIYRLSVCWKNHIKKRRKRKKKLRLQQTNSSQKQEDHKN